MRTLGALNVRGLGVEENSPMKRGLKYLRRGREGLMFHVEENSPMKRGLKSMLGVNPYDATQKLKRTPR